MVNFGYPYNDIVICKDSTDYLAKIYCQSHLHRHSNVKVHFFCKYGKNYTGKSGKIDKELMNGGKICNFLTSIQKSFKLFLNSHENELAILKNMLTSSRISP